ncbi:carbohydrate esterase family 5 protein [Coniophora puteana RWD-64-598 SS2]|uniref:cutinase n=1 Tax=Coniophora puteana (strain RWD-64-598) TaxID=741705 RepID=A0A5M3MAM5_CONPW|nr:carbohydrate esterase family 5 protein [Coniophora puteana RWD-64-598 SS2]EIW75914.1 carbohydrate esterase family 5 protein [Coniophora puteana RWD-64-598 SS2]
MKLFLASLATYLTFTSATPVRRGGDDTVNDMSSVISGSAPCAAVGVLFARGTFDSGNIGVWVGPDFNDALKSNIPSVAVEGVDPTAYPATLDSYLSEGGSNSGAQSMAQTAQAYVQKCPNAALVIAGWSQGALVAHKALDQLDDATRGKVAGLVTFGDPWHLFSDETPSVTTQGYCVTGTVFDPLCANLPSDFKLPTSVDDIVGPFKDLPSAVQGWEQTKAAASLVEQFPGELSDAWDGFVQNLQQGGIQRAMLTPQHFTYGNNGMASQAAQYIAGLDMVKAAQA